MATEYARFPDWAQDSEEQVVKVEADRVLGVRGRREAVVLQAERLAVGLVVSIFDPSYESPPDLVLDGHRNLPELHVVTGGDRFAAADTLRIGKILGPEGGTERRSPVIRGVSRDTAPSGVGVLSRAERDQGGIILLAGEVEVDRQRDLVDAGVENRRVDEPAVVDVPVHLAAILLGADQEVHGRGELVDRRERERAGRTDVAVVVVRVVPALRETHGRPE